MYRRKLTALGHHNPDGFNVKDESQFRNVIVWLEDQKIRHYKIEDREGLRNTQVPEWENAFVKYLEELACPMIGKDKGVVIDWILGYAVRLEYGDNVDKYKAAGKGKSDVAKSKSSNPLDSMDFESADFKAGVASLAQMLQIPPHPDHKKVMQAVCLLIKEKLSKEALEQVQKSPQQNGTSTLPLDKMDLGFETGDYISQEAAKILRLLHIRDLRDLQDQVNAAIVGVQALTANPKTDTRLGKVGK